MARKRYTFGDIASDNAEDILMAENYLRSHNWTYRRMKFDKIFEDVDTPMEWYFDSEHLDRFNELVADAAEMRVNWPAWRERAERWFGPLVFVNEEAKKKAKNKSSKKPKVAKHEDIPLPMPSFEPKTKKHR